MINPRSIATLGFSCKQPIAIATIGFICVTATQDLTDLCAQQVTAFTTPYHIEVTTPKQDTEVAKLLSSVSVHVPTDGVTLAADLQYATIDRDISHVTTEPVREAQEIDRDSSYAWFAAPDYSVQMTAPSYNIRVSKGLTTVTIT